ncbi:MAG: hydrolase [Candidatus Saccharibacteria bacterium]|nr:hydrolase [Candidatus Saccharibacteria bacterium]
MRTNQPAENIRHKIQEEIKALRPLDSLESQHRDDVLEWIDSGADLFRIQKPDIPPKHLVSYFVLIDPVQKSMLLVDHIKAQLWLPTGGHVELNEHPKETVKRETTEELRMKAVFLRNNDSPFFITVTETGGLTPGHTDVSLWYLLKGSAHDFIDYDRTEFNDIEWFSFEEILQSDSVIFDPHLQRFTRKLINYLA